jgi:hypothetical protein
MFPEEPQVYDGVPATLWRFLKLRNDGEIVFRQLRHRLANWSATGIVHGRSPGAFAAECLNNFCGSNRICTAAVTFLEAFG